MVEDEKSSEGQKPKKSGAKVALIIVVAAILICIFWGLGTVLHRLKENNNLVHCVNNLCQLRLAFKSYADDNAEKYPTPKEWCDLLRSELAEDCNHLYICPSKISSGERCSYVMNPNAEPNSPLDTVLLFEGIGGWNQVGSVKLVNFDNHDSKGCTMLFCDYSIRFVKPEEVGQLSWK